ncbi:MAG: hypothetical protein HY921_05645 [Elusimicrobia bacterium]|nr:hypothetical protein [Elusimicrobiota bacterium]
MTPRDFSLLVVWALLILAISFPVWLCPGLSFKNFGDLYTYHYPLRHLAWSSLQAGRLPFWNPYIFAGLPLLANSQAAFFYPVSALCGIFPLSLALSWDCLFHVFWSGLGIFLLSRSQRLSSSGSLSLSLAYALSPFLVYRITEGIPTLLSSLAWAPWCWLAWLSGAPGALAACWALQFLSGHPQFMIANAMALALWAASSPSIGKTGRALAREGLLALGLCAVQSAPTLEFLGQSGRRGWPLDFALGYSFELKTLASWLFPGAWGSPVGGGYSGPPSVFFETSGVYVGLLGLVLAAFGLCSGKARRSWILLGAGLFLASGGRNPFYRALLSWTPLGFLRTPSRYLFLCLWGLILAAGAGWKLLQRRRRFSAGAGGTLVAVLALDLLVWDWAYLRPEENLPYLRPSASFAQQMGGGAWRLITDPELANPNKTMLYRAMNVNGYEAFFLSAFPEYAAKSEGRAAVDASRGYLRRHETLEMSRLGVKYFLAEDGQWRHNPAALPLAYFVGLSGAAVKNYVKLEIARPEHWRLRARVPGEAGSLVLAQPFYPGWRTYVNGQEVPLGRWEGFLQFLNAADFHSSTAEIDIIFRPTFWPVWVMLSVGLWIYGGVFWTRRFLA